MQEALRPQSAPCQSFTSDLGTMRSKQPCEKHQKGNSAGGKLPIFDARPCYATVAEENRDNRDDQITPEVVDQPFLAKSQPLHEIHGQTPNVTLHVKGV